MFAIKSDEEIYVCCDGCGSIYLCTVFACISENISRLDLLKNINFQEVSFEEIINKGWRTMFMLDFLDKNNG